MTAERRFSERIGAVAVSIQIGSMNQRLRASIWNLVQETFADDHDDVLWQVKKIADAVIGLPVDLVDQDDPREWLLKQYAHMSWDRVYDLLEYVANYFGFRVVSGEVDRPEFQRR